MKLSEKKTFFAQDVCQEIIFYYTKVNKDEYVIDEYKRNNGKCKCRNKI